MSREMKDSGIEWIGIIPSSWNVSHFKFVIEKNESGVWGDDPQGVDDKVILRSTEQTIDGHWKIDNPAVRSMASVPNYHDLYCKENDLLITKSSGSTLHIGKTTLVTKEIADRNALFSNFLQRVRLKPDENAKFYWYILNSDLARKQFSFMQNSTSGIGNLNATYINNLLIPRIPMGEQLIITKYLDGQCSSIDSALARTRDSIEEYKKLKQAVITRAVTKGIRGKRPMKDSGVEWIGSVPEDWQVFRVANLYKEASDKGNDELPILTVSINSGVSDRELSDEESERVFVRSEDRSKYKRVQPGDLVYNMMRAWQGAFGAVRVDGMVSPAYVVARPMEQLDSRYVEYLFRTPEAIEEMHRYSYGVADFRLRLYWPQFRNIRMCVPSYEEQVEIADYIDSKVQEILALIKKKEQYLVELENYKKSLIYEYVTGKKEVPPIA